MTGYVRVDTSNNIADGNVISADDLDNEFDGIQAAFNASTGHNHDGTTGEGAPISVLGPTQDIVVSASTVLPKTTNTVDIGSSSLKFKDLFLAGNTSIAGTLAVTGVTTFTAQPVLSSLTASRAVFTDGSKGLVSNAITGTGNVVMSASPTLTGTISAEALTTSSTVTLNGGTANGVAYLNGSKVLTTGSALTFDGTGKLNVSSATGSASPTPSELQIATTTSASDWSTTSPWGRLSFYSADASAAGAKIHAQIAATAATTAGGYSSLNFSVIDTSGTALLETMEFVADGSNSTQSIFYSGAGVEGMRLTSTGLGIGTSSPSVALDVSGVASAGTVRATTSFQLVDSLSSARNVMQLAADDLTIQTGTSAGARSIYFLTEGLERLRIDSSGNVGIGTSSPTNALSVTGNANITGNVTLGDATTDTVQVNGYMGVGAAPTGNIGLQIFSSALTGAGPIGIASTPVGPATATTSVRAVFGRADTAAASFTVADVMQFQAANSTKGAGSTITNQHGVYIADQTQGTNNYGITSLVSSGTNKWNIYASGTAANYMAGQLQLGDGSAAAPALSNFGDENTGIFFPAADTIAFAEGGAEAMRITSAGKLLVGDSSAPSISASFMGGGGSAASIAALGSATTPIQISSFSGTAGYAGYLAFTRGKGTDSSDASVPVADGNRLGSMVFFGADGTDFTSDAAYITATVDGAVATGSVPGALSFFTNAAGSSTPTERLRIDSSGNVGIGTSSPLARLNTYQVNGGGEAATLFQNFSTTTNTTVALYLSPTNGSLTTGSIRAGFIKAINVGSGVTALTFGTNSSGADPTEKMRIDSSGNVGIGTSSPTVRLQVSSATASQIYATDTTSGNTAQMFASSAGAVFGSFTNADVQIRTNNTERMRIDSSGNVGIGSSSPAGKLEVNVGSSAAWFTRVAGDVGVSNAAIGLLTTATTGQIRSYGDMLFYTTTVGGSISEKMRIDSSGNVGIGTSSPVGNLDVAGTAPTLNIRDTQSKTWVAGDTVGTLDFYSNDTSGVGAQAVSRIRSVADIASAAPTGALAFWTAAAGSAATEKLRITSAGDVGIGTSTPGALLDVAASGGATIDIRNSATSSTTNDLVGALDFISSDNSSSQGGLPRGYIRTYIAESLGTGGYMTFGTAATGSGGIAERLRLDSSGNLGLGVTPSAWASTYGAFQIKAAAAIWGTTDTSFVAVGANTFNGASGTTYINTDFASRYYQIDGTHVWQTAPSGTADAAITFTQAMTLDADGDLGIGTTSTASTRMTIVGGALPTQDNGNTNALQFSAGVTGRRASGNTVGFIGTYANASSIEISAGQTGSGISIHGQAASANANTVIAYTNSLERARIDASGNVQVQAGAVVVWAPAPASISTTATLTNANIQGQIINTTGTSYTVTMPLGTTLETLVPWASTNLGYDFTVINTASGTITMAINTGVTSLGGLTIATGTSAQFRIRRTATNTFVLYRMR